MTGDRYRGISPKPLTLARVRTGPDTVRLAVGGEVDLATADQLATAMAQALADGRLNQLVVDLDQVTFLDSTGVATLMAAYRLADGSGTGFVVTNCRDNVRRVLEITGVYKSLAAGDSD
jgi:anti-sigma B factor antagonist/stage II sporulation protein AA (anti-sigma F factor antagonist)